MKYTHRFYTYNKENTFAIMRKVSTFLTFATLVVVSAGRPGTALEKQDTAPCFGAVSYISSANESLVSLSAAKECYSKVKLDVNNTMQGILSIMQTLRHSYAFYNYAVDAPDSSPLNNPYNWPIYNGTSGGQTNLTQKQEELINEIIENGASLLTVMRLQTAVSSPRDAHIGFILKFMNNGVLNNTDLFVLDKSEFDAQNAGIPISRRYLTLEEMQGEVFAVIKSYVNETVLKVIDTIDGVGAVQYLEGFVSLPVHMGAPSLYKALGSRVQRLLRYTVNLAPWLFQIPSVSNAFDSLPDSVEVKFTDGSSTIWEYLYSPGHDSNETQFSDYSVEELIKYANTQPKDSPYVAFGEAMKLAAESRSVPDYPKQSTKSRADKARRVIDTIDQTPSTPLNWTFFHTKDEEIISDSNTDILFAVTTIDNATILKFQSFSLTGPSGVQDSAKLCKYLYDFAENNGNTKLVIDLTDNIGGTVDQAFAMTQCLYPQATYDQLYLPYESRWSSYDVQRFYLETESNTIVDEILSDDDIIKSISVVLKNDIPSALVMLQRLRNILKGMLLLDVPGNVQKDIWTVSRMIDEVKRSKHFKTSFVKTLLAMPDFSGSIVGISPDIGSLLDGRQAVEKVIQGGIETMSNTNWTRFRPMVYEEIKKSLEGMTNPYTSYAIIGNGLGGSSSSTFEMNVMETSQLNPAWTPAKSYSYGCVGKKESCPVNQFQGGMLRNGRNLNTLSYRSLGWFEFLTEYLGKVSNMVAAETVIQNTISTIPNIDKYVVDVKNFIKQVPGPPIGATADYNSWEFPAYYVLSKITGFGSIPAEYFAVPPSKYIPFWPNAPKLGKGEEQYRNSVLLPVYTQVANDM